MGFWNWFFPANQMTITVTLSGNDRKKLFASGAIVIDLLEELKSEIESGVSLDVQGSMKS